ncbi:GALK2-like protein [Mya arenaria]|uniref:GALK2-like protein n=1 Tax=Mya arenaria TaxID=6604 RepID=A0ABY7DM31_MYAAR|nr:N-acetylgalactosamine kinase-like [Mya arenaria]WAQ97787.1 GALK2-like protein [Mya arenaria]
MADAPPPVNNEIPLLYADRYNEICKKFMETFGTEPSFYARAPGRVNLIGEHIDYCGYGVLPMAVEQDIVIAVSTNNTNKLRLANADQKYRQFECSVDDYEIDKNSPQWFHYFLCGFKGMCEMLGLSRPTGMECIVDGHIPCNAGLSSSSALVCCAALATMQANGSTRSKKDIADMCAACERYIGTQGGGMDQAISFMAEAGTAKKIDFNPLREMSVSLPGDVVFVVSNCCVEKNKAASSDFNTRVVECRIASQIMAKSKGLEWRQFRRFADLQGCLGLGLGDMMGVVGAELHPGTYSKPEVCQILGVTPEELAETSLSPNTLHVQAFQLYDRAMHVYGEAGRVEEFRAICDTSGASLTLGGLMNASHDSCSRLYQCSCAELDELVALCVKSGAIGSRLTGAGWGGCAISMVPREKLGDFLERVRREYYEPRGLGAAVNEALFATQPGSGAAVYLAK